MADAQIFSGSKESVPKSYEVPSSAAFVLKAVNADFDGAGAGGSYTPCVTILSDSGHVIARAVDNTIVVASGSDAEVSWFPLRRRRRVAAPTGLECVLLGSGIGDTTLTMTLTKAVPAKGSLFAIWGQVSVPDGVDGGSDCTNVVDSGGHGPWVRPAAPGTSPVIGDTRQTDAGNAFSVQSGGAARACVGADLGIGSTVTMTFSSVAPANFHTAGLLIYVPAYFIGVQQGNFPTGFAAVKYNLNLGAPGSVATLNALSWDSYYGPPPWQYARQDAVMITAMGSYPPVAGFTPYNGTLIGEETGGSVGIAASCSTQCEGSVHDPGGTWPSNAQGLVGNYQLLQPRTCQTG